MRDRLIELLGLYLPIKVRNEMGSYDTVGERTLSHNDREKLADHLLANGVTVQEWISVKDRLPEQTDPATYVLGIDKKGRCYIAYYYKGVTDDWFTGFYANAMKVNVTHWTPLPQPPKGE